MNPNNSIMAGSSLSFSDKVFSVVKGKCPRCGVGNHFESNNPLNVKQILNVHTRCSHCNLNFNPEIGFYWGATYASYMITVAFSVSLFVASVIIFGFYKSLNINFVILNAILLVLFAPYFVRLSRTMWLWWFYEDKA